jgi:hypothetical protein
LGTESEAELAKRNERATLAEKSKSWKKANCPNMKKH